MNGSAILLILCFVLFCLAAFLPEPLPYRIRLMAGGLAAWAASTFVGRL